MRRLVMAAGALAIAAAGTIGGHDPAAIRAGNRPPPARPRRSGRGISASQFMSAETQARIKEANAAKRADRGRKLRARVLAGGFGVAAQYAMWDVVWPMWARDLGIVNRRARGLGDRDPLSAAEEDYVSALSEALNANGRWLARPWYRLLMQDMTRMHHLWMGKHGRSIPWRFRWGGYPIDDRRPNKKPILNPAEAVA